MKYWLYRVNGNDDEGDPLDFGVVEADDYEEAQELVAKHLGDLGIGEYDGLAPVYFYSVINTSGVWQTQGREEVTLEIPEAYADN